MFDAAPATGFQRAEGRAEVVLGVRGIERLAQSGCAKAFLPRCHRDAPEIVFLNTSGGLTGGDRLSYACRIAGGLRATVTTQTAERAYASAGGRAEVAVLMSAGRGARLDWLPQETILFDRAALHRFTRIDLGAGAACLFAETVVLGRAAMGERVTSLDLSDRREIWRDGEPVLVEPLRLTDAVLARTGSLVLHGMARAVSTIALVAPGAEDRLAPVRSMLHADGVEAAASAWGGRIVVRALAVDGWPMRRLVAQVVVALGGVLPRVWQT